MRALHSTRTALLTTSALLLTAGLCFAQELDADEKKFVAAVAAVVSSSASEAETDKEREEAPNDKQDLSLEIELPKHEIQIARFSTGKRAFEAASDMALYSSWADDPLLIEVRGRDVLVVEGPLASEGEAAELRTAAWKAYPWAGATSKIQLLHLNLMEDGLVTRINKPHGEAYEHLKKLLARAKKAHADNQTNPDQDAETKVELISPTEVKVTEGGLTSHLKVEDTKALQVISPATPSKVLVAFSKVIQLPLPDGAFNGAAGALNGIGQ